MAFFPSHQLSSKTSNCDVKHPTCTLPLHWHCTHCYYKVTLSYAKATNKKVKIFSRKYNDLGMA